MSQHFDPVVQPEKEGAEGADDAKLDEESLEPDESDMEDDKLAEALGARKVAGQGSSSESLHTGLTGDLEKVHLSTPVGKAEVAEPEQSEGGTALAEVVASPPSAPPTSKVVVILDGPSSAKIPPAKKMKILADPSKMERIQLLKQLGPIELTIMDHNMLL